MLKWTIVPLGMKRVEEPSEPPPVGRVVSLKAVLELLGTTGCK